MSQKFKLVFFLRDMEDNTPPIDKADWQQMVIELDDDDIAVSESAIARQEALDAMPQNTEEEKELWRQESYSLAASRRLLAELLLAMGDKLGRYCHTEIDKRLADKNKVAGGV